MKLDKRIIDYHDIRCFASRNNHECLGKVGYFAEDISELEDLDKCAKGICCFRDGEDFPFFRFDHTTRGPTHPKKAYPIFCPVSATKEKIYRPYTFEEFLEKFTIGRPISYRRKDEVGSERLLILNGFSKVVYPNRISHFIHIGSAPYTLEELFREYEWQDKDFKNFQPFGVEVEEDE